MPNAQEYITVCELMRAHGVKGYIKAMPCTHDLERHSLLKEVLVRKVNGEELSLTLEDSKLAGNLWHLKFKGFDTPEAVAVLVNGEVLIPETDRLPAPEGQFYPDELEGFRVQTEDGRDVGEVLEVVELPTVNAFNIKFEAAVQNEFSKKTILAPWIKDCVKTVDAAGKRIVCDGDYLRALCPEDHSSEARKEMADED